MKPEKVKKSYLSRAFRKAVVSGLAVLALSFSVQAQNRNNSNDDDIYNTGTSKTKEPVKTPTATTFKMDSTLTQQEPWQKDSGYVREMDFALKAYLLQVKALNEQTAATINKINRERYMSSSGNIDLMHVFTSGSQTKASISKVEATTASQLSSMETYYNQQKDYIAEKYKQKYERQQAQILRMKKATAVHTPEEEKIMTEKKDLDLVKKQLELEKQKLDLQKQIDAFEKQKKDFEQKQKQIQTLQLPPKL